MSKINKIAQALGAAILFWPTPCFIILIAIIGLIKGCIGDDIDPMDNSINKEQMVLTETWVIDRNGNGFKVLYTTANAVTKERWHEIFSRKHIWDAMEKLQAEAPLHWNGNMLDADICDFALFALKYNVDKDVEINKITVCGNEKKNLYVQPNPNLPGCATRMDPMTEQGNQYLKKSDINFLIPNGGRIYRYWKADILYESSDTDERFSHFREKNRVQNR